MFCSFCGEKNSDNFRFCSSCGKPRESNVKPSSENDDEKIEFVLRPKGVVLSLENEKWDFELCDVYKQMVGTKHFDNVIFDAIFTSKRVLLRPVSKSSSPGLAQAADLLGKKISSFLSESSTNLVGKSVDVQILNSLPAWRNDSLFKVEYSLPTIMKAAGTVLSFDGISNVSSVSSKTRLHLVFEGSAAPSKKQFLEFPYIAKLCEFDISRATKF
jgi:zinc-ribbon domain